MEKQTWVAGVDGCRAGWFVMLHAPETGAVRCRRVEGVEALFALPEAPAVIGIDVIIGLPDTPRSGGRVRLLAANGFPDVDAAVAQYAESGVASDDVLDAHAACWTARRIHHGTAERLPPGDPPRNARGLRMEIWR